MAKKPKDNIVGALSTPKIPKAPSAKQMAAPMPASGKGMLQPARAVPKKPAKPPVHVAKNQFMKPRKSARHTSDGDQF